MNVHQVLNRRLGRNGEGFGTQRSAAFRGREIKRPQIEDVVVVQSVALNDIGQQRVVVDRGTIEIERLISGCADVRDVAICSTVGKVLAWIDLPYEVERT